jgi:hypothetical protein
VEALMKARKEIKELEKLNAVTKLSYESEKSRLISSERRIRYWYSSYS